MSGKIDPYLTAEISPETHPRYNWKVIWLDPRTQKKRKKFFHTKVKAIEWIETEYLDLLQQRAGQSVKTSFTFADACQFYRDLGKSGVLRRKPLGDAHIKRLETLERLYLKDWEFFDTPIDMTPEDACFAFMREKAALRKGAAARACEFIKSASALARRERKSRTDPFADTKVPDKSPSEASKSRTNKKIPNTEQVKEILARIQDKADRSARKDSRDKWLKLLAMCEIAATTGMRVSEIRCLRRENVDLTGRVIYVVEAIEAETKDTVKKPKTDAGTRAIPISDSLVEMLRKYIDAFAVEKGPMFLTSAGTFFERRNMNRDLREVLKGTGLPKIGMHGFRHYYVSRLIAAGADAKTLPTLAGHTDFRFTVQQYGHLLTDVADRKFAVGL